MESIQAKWTTRPSDEHGSNPDHRPSDSLSDVTRPVSVALAFLVLCLRSAGGQQSPSSADRFSLYNLCAPVRLVVDPLPEDAVEIGLATSQLEALAESRLRAADLYSDNALTILSVGASRFAIELQYKKPVIDVASNESKTIRTFSRTAVVRDGTAAGLMLEVSKLLDLFLVEYERVNGPACGDGDQTTQRSGSDTPAPVEASGPPRVATLKSPGGDTVEPPPYRNPESSRAKGSDGIRWGRMWPVPDDENTVHRISDEVTSPRLLSKVEPEYSDEARDKNVEGTVGLAIEVWEDGRANNIRVVRSVGFGLDEKAIESVKKWRFIPGLKDGKPVKVAAQIHVSFKLIADPERRR